MLVQRQLCTLLDLGTPVGLTCCTCRQLCRDRRLGIPTGAASYPKLIAASIYPLKSVMK